MTPNGTFVTSLGGLGPSYPRASPNKVEVERLPWLGFSARVVEVAGLCLDPVIEDSSSPQDPVVGDNVLATCKGSNCRAKHRPVSTLYERNREQVTALLPALPRWTDSVLYYPNGLVK